MARITKDMLIMELNKKDTEIADLRAENRWLKRENEIFVKMVNAPPTVMIACERIVESAAHLVSDARSMINMRR